MITKFEVEKSLISTRYIDECFGTEEKVESFGEVDTVEALKENLSIQESDA